MKIVFFFVSLQQFFLVNDSTGETVQAQNPAGQTLRQRLRELSELLFAR